MIRCAVFDTCQEELRVIEEVMHREAGYLSDDEWKMEFLEKMEKLFLQLVEGENLDILGLDITAPGMLEKLVMIREKYQEARMLIIADGKVSPMAYLRPAVRPDALLLRPCGKEKIQEVFRELFLSYLNWMQGEKITGSFAVETREGRTLLAYPKILYFEAREKKIFVRSGREEFGFYDTMERLQERLPEDFVRCHRGFIVNRSRVKRVMISQNFLELDTGEILPVSRSYRAEVKQI